MPAIAVIVVFLPSLASANYFTLPVDATIPNDITAYFDHDADESELVRYDGASVFEYDNHNGTDFGGNENDDILAPADGEVKDVYWNNEGGWTMHIWHEEIGLSTLYAHLGTTTIATTSDAVSRGDHIAEMSSTGASSTATHLHFGVVDDDELSGNRIDPFGWQGTGTDPWPYNQGYLWTTDPPSLDLAKTITSNIGSNITWRGNYVINGAPSVNSGATLTLDPGTIVKFQTNQRRLRVNGTLDAQGTAERPIYFTSYKDDTVGDDTNGDGSASSPAGGDWREIEIGSTGSSTLSHVVARYGGANTCCGQSRANVYNNGGILNIFNSTLATSSSVGSGFKQASGTTTIESTDVYGQPWGLVLSNGNLSVSESSIHDNTSGGISASAGILSVASTTFADNDNAGSVWGAVDITLSNNTATGTGQKFVMSNNVSGNKTWTADNIPYVLSSNVTVNSGSSLAIEQGAVLKFESSSSRLTISGTLDVQGATTSKVYFTSIKDDSVGGDTDGADDPPGAGDWRHITLNSTASTTLSHAVIRYGGASGFGSMQANINNSGGNLTIVHSQIATSSVYGIRSQSGTTTVTHTEANDNTYGLYVSGGVVGDVSSSSFHGNSSYGMYNSTASTIDAEDNHWGASDGPSGEGTGSGDAVSTKVDFDPWLSTWP